MNRIHCHGKLSRSTAPFHIDRAGYHLSFDTVPTWVCKQCGEVYFEEHEVNAIQSTVDSLGKPASSIKSYRKRQFVLR